MDVDLTFSRGVAKQLEIEAVVVGRLEHGAAVVPSLDDVVTKTANEDTWASWHISVLASRGPEHVRAIHA